MPASNEAGGSEYARKHSSKGLCCGLGVFGGCAGQGLNLGIVGQERGNRQAILRGKRRSEQPRKVFWRHASATRFIVASHAVSMVETAVASSAPVVTWASNLTHSLVTPASSELR